MAKMERVREAIHGKLDLDDMQHKYAAGWRLAALEWEREAAEDEPPATGSNFHELPFGLRVAADCAHLEEDPTEMKALNTMMELIVQDISMQRMADELNRAGFTTRSGQPWTTVSIFQIFPRLIEVTPQIFNEEGWRTRRREIGRVVWNS
ncbi:MAG: recombinase family protein [Candidatus Acidiferrales bacterium]